MSRITFTTIHNAIIAQHGLTRLQHGYSDDEHRRGWLSFRVDSTGAVGVVEVERVRAHTTPADFEGDPELDAGRIFVRVGNEKMPRLIRDLPECLLAVAGGGATPMQLPIDPDYCESCGWRIRAETEAGHAGAGALLNSKCCQNCGSPHQTPEAGSSTGPAPAPTTGRTPRSLSLYCPVCGETKGSQTEARCQHCGHERRPKRVLDFTGTSTNTGGL